MEGSEFVLHLMEITIILFAVIVVAMFLKKFRFPYTIGLVLAGMGMRWVMSSLYTSPHLSLDQIYFTPEIILYVLLPTLIFEAAMNIDSRYLINNLIPIFTLAAPGVLISTAIVTIGLSLITNMAIFPALLFGALISATDPVAVIHIFHEIGAPKRLNVLVDGESLFNDATAIVLFNMVLQQSSNDLVGNVLTVLFRFFYVFFGGVIIGILVALMMLRIINSAKKEPFVQITSLTIIAYLAFILANYYLEVSGVMATLAAGIVISWYTNIQLSEEVKNYITIFWGYMAFIANSVIFLLLGMTMYDTWRAPGVPYMDLLMYGFWSIVFVLIARMAIVYVLLPCVEYFFKKSHVDMNYKHIIFWGGLRGALPLALALSLSSSSEYRAIIMSCTVSVILFTLIVQGTTLRSLMHFLKLDAKNPAEEYNDLELRVATKKGALNRLGQLKHENCFDNQEIEKLEKEYHESIKFLLEQLEFSKKNQMTRQYKKELFWDQLLSLEKKLYRRQYLSGFFSLNVLEELQMNIDEAREKIKEGEYPEIFTVHVPFDVKLRSSVIKFIGRFISTNPWILKYITKAYVTKYEISLAMAIVSRQIQLEIKQLAGVFDLDKSIEDECRKFYIEREKAALKYVQEIAEEDVPLSVRNEKIRIVATMAELFELNKRKEETDITEKIYKEIEGELESSLKAHRT